MIYVYKKIDNPCFERSDGSRLALVVVYNTIQCFIYKAVVIVS